MPTLHEWNDFCIESRARKAPAKRSPCKKVRYDSAAPISGEQQQDNFVSENLPAIDFNFGHEDMEEINENLKREIDLLKSQLNESKEAYRLLHFKTSSAELTIMTSIQSADKVCNHYTGFPTLDRLTSVFNFLDAGSEGENIILHHNQIIKERGISIGHGRKRSLSPFEGFILTLIRLRRNFSMMHLAFLFKTSESTVSSLIITWINFLYIRLGSICIWPSRKIVQKTLPASMKEKYPNVRCIIDCVEFKVEVPVSLIMHKMFYSDYKSHTTVKCLVGISPAGGFSFISSVFPGSISDKEITIRSGILSPSLWESGDGLMADRGFTIADYTKPLGVELVIPDFLRARKQLTAEEIINSQQIANERIHVERMIQRLKCYHIFDRVVPLTMIGSLNQIISVCAMLANFQEPIIALK